MKLDSRKESRRDRMMRSKSFETHEMRKICRKEVKDRIFYIYPSRESELYRYILDGTSALAWELPFPRCLGHLSST